MNLEGKRIAILAENNYHELELWYPLLRMREAGASVIVVGMPGVEEYHSKLGLPVKVDAAADELSANDFDALIVPGGYAPDLMRRHAPMLKLVREMYESGKLVAFICHAAWVPISAGIVRSKRATCLPAIQDDLVNAGAIYVDEEAVQDGNMISSRSPADLPAFCRAIIAYLRPGR